MTRLPRPDPERPPRRRPRIPQRSIDSQKQADPPGGVPQHGDAGHSVAYQAQSEKGQASGYAGLDGAGRLDAPSDHISVDASNVSNPPTAAELTAAFGDPATLAHGTVRLVDDAGAGTAVWLVCAVNGAWWYELLTKAV